MSLFLVGRFLLSIALHLVVAVVGPYLVWNYLLTMWVDLPPFGFWPILGIYLLLRAPSMLLRFLWWVPRFIREMKEWHQEYQRKEQIKKKLVELLLAGDSDAAMQFLTKLHTDLLRVKTEAAMKLTRLEIEEFTEYLRRISS